MPEETLSVEEWVRVTGTSYQTLGRICGVSPDQVRAWVVLGHPMTAGEAKKLRRAVAWRHNLLVEACRSTKRVLEQITAMSEEEEDG